MSFAGKWKRVEVVNDEALYKRMGVEEETIKSFTNCEVSMEMKQTGDLIEEEYVMGDFKTKEVFTIDKESDFKHWDGTYFKTIPKRLNEKKFKIEYDYKGVHYCFTRELTNPTKIVDSITLDNGEVKGMFVFEKV